MRLDWLNPSYVRSLVEVEKKSLEQVSNQLKIDYPNQNGLSVANIKKFCSENNIHKNQPISTEEVDNLVAAGVSEVGGTYGRKMMCGHLEQSHGVTVSQRRMRESLQRVHPYYHNNRLRGIQNQVNPSSYHAPYFGYNLHMDQNEKLEMFGIVYVAAIDGKSGFVTSCKTMPKKNNITIYRDVLRETISTYGLFEQIVVDHGKEFYLALFIQHYLSNLRPCQRLPYKQVVSMKNNRIERWWVELNKRVLYPIKYCLLDLEREDQAVTVDRQNPNHLFSISVVAQYVATYGAAVTQNAWNAHTIPSHGKPKQYLSENKATKLAEEQIPTVESAVALYEQTGGVLTREGTTGDDLLATFPELQLQRDTEYFNVVLPHIGTVSYLFGCISNHNYSPFQNAIVEHLNLSKRFYDAIDI